MALASVMAQEVRYTESSKSPATGLPANSMITKRGELASSHASQGIGPNPGCSSRGLLQPALVALRV